MRNGVQVRCDSYRTRPTAPPNPGCPEKKIDFRSQPLLSAGLYLLSTGLDGGVVVWDVAARVPLVRRTSAMPVVAASWHPTNNSLALQVIPCWLGSG